MSAEMLRRAAALMRERAEAAPLETPWSRRSIDRQGTCDGCAQGRRLVAAYADYSGENEPWLCAECAAAADFETSWHPAVALAVADWLDDVAETWELFDSGELPPHAWSMLWDASEHKALAVARAYLGED